MAGDWGHLDQILRLLRVVVECQGPHDAGGDEQLPACLHEQGPSAEPISDKDGNGRGKEIDKRVGEGGDEPRGLLRQVGEAKHKEVWQEEQEAVEEGNLLEHCECRRHEQGRNVPSVKEHDLPRLEARVPV